jgi:hypothetical protein
MTRQPKLDCSANVKSAWHVCGHHRGCVLTLETNSLASYLKPATNHPLNAKSVLTRCLGIIRIYHALKDLRTLWVTFAGPVFLLFLMFWLRAWYRGRLLREDASENTTLEFCPYAPMRIPPSINVHCSSSSHYPIAMESLCRISQAPR